MCQAAVFEFKGWGESEFLSLPSFRVQLKNANWECTMCVFVECDSVYVGACTDKPANCSLHESEIGTLQRTS